MSGEYVCEPCRHLGEDFRVPADEVGVELMKAHLYEKHAELMGVLR